MDKQVECTKIINDLDSTRNTDQKLDENMYEKI